MNMQNYEHKFKERSPEETIKIIREFFESRGLTIKTTAEINSEANTHSCHIAISLGDYTILGSNGKGINEQYSLASGYAELYERFSNRLNLYFSPVLYDLYTKMQFEQKHFHVAPDEKLMTPQEILTNSKVVYDFLCGFMGTEENALELIKIFNNYNPEIYGVPYKNLKDPTKIKYYNQPSLYRVCTSNGLAAGNTEEEALNQGLAELFERWGIEKFCTIPQDCYYEIDLNTIEDEYLTSRFNQIKDSYGVHLYDLSYNFDIPVMMLILADPRTHRFYINFGSFPVVGIAIERTLTEIYQGFETFEEMGENQIPGRSLDGYTQINLDGNSTIGMVSIPEEMFFHSKLVSYNKEVYLSNKDYDNKDILKQYYINLCDKLNLDIYYRNNTLTPEMAAIHVISDNINTQNTKVPYVSDYTQERRNEKLKELKNYLKNSQIILNDIFNNKLNLDIFNKLHHIPYYSSDPKDGDFLGCLYMSEWCCISQFIVKCCGVLSWYLDLYNSSLNTHGLFSHQQNQSIKKFITLQNYSSSGLYSNEELIKLFKVWNIDITEEDIERCFDPTYVFYNFYLKDEYNFAQQGYANIFLKAQFDREENYDNSRND